jgi:hypothetical protein
MTSRIHAWQAHFFPTKPPRSPVASRLAATRLRPTDKGSPRPTAALRARLLAAQATRRPWRLGFLRLLPQRVSHRRSDASLEERAP